MMLHDPSVLLRGLDHLVGAVLAGNPTWQVCINLRRAALMVDSVSDYGMHRPTCRVLSSRIMMPGLDSGAGEEVTEDEEHRLLNDWRACRLVGAFGQRSSGPPRHSRDDH